MRWSAVCCLPVLAIVAVAMAEADEPIALPSPAAPRVAHDTTPRQPPVPLPVPEAPVQQVLLHIKLVELTEENLRRLGLDFSQAQLLQGLPDLNGSLEALGKEGPIRVLAEPTLVTVMERPARCRFGGQIKLWNLGPDGKPAERAEHVGTCVDFVPHLIDKRDLRIELKVEVSEVDRTKSVFVAGKKNPAIRQRVVDTALEVKLGETSALTCPMHAVGGARIDPTSTVIVLLVTVEAVDPMAAVLPSDRLGR